MNHMSATAAELDAMTYDQLQEHAQRELAELPPGCIYADDLIESFEMLLFQKKTGIFGIFMNEPEGLMSCK